ncbi:MAG: hypothetical protein A2V90_03010 [Gammaproteobacteria bacterium RBG_16_57_12]|nr:MAG: hypothetical protein A2V90_03010 [Gammaproteobacteria bacterium RBG_16_57_12]
MKRKSLLLVIALLATSGANAGVVDDLLRQYQAQASQPFDAERAKALWTAKHRDPETGKDISCSTCHTADLRKAGEHNTTGKPIEPMAPSINPQRLTDAAKIEKWFKRNCKGTFNRECTPQEKGDFLTYFRNQ